MFMYHNYYEVLFLQADKAPTRALINLIKTRPNDHFDKFCKALYETKQTHIVQNWLIIEGMWFIYSGRSGL